MLAGGLSSSLRKPLIWGSVLCLLLAVMALLVWSSFADALLDKREEIAYSTPLPPRPVEPARSLRSAFSPDANAPDVEGALANPAFTEPTADPLKPSEPDLQLVDASPFGPLPRIADDGRRSIETYARPHDGANDGPKVAIIMTGLGQQADATNATFHLPGAISLMFSPYSEDLPVYFERARLSGHEVLLELPMEPRDYPASDPGPHTLRASGTVDANIERLNWVLARAPGYFAVAGRSGAFADSSEARAVLRALAAKGVGMIEIEGNGLEEASKTVGLAYMSTADRIDATPTSQAIEQALDALEDKARDEGYALGVADAYPVTLQRLIEWSASVEERGVILVPASSILREAADPIAADDQASNIAQSRN